MPLDFCGLCGPSPPPRTVLSWPTRSCLNFVVDIRLHYLISCSTHRFLFTSSHKKIPAERPFQHETKVLFLFAATGTYSILAVTPSSLHGRRHHVYVACVRITDVHCRSSLQQQPKMPSHLKASILHPTAQRRPAWNVQWSHLISSLSFEYVVPSWSMRRIRRIMMTFPIIERC